MLPRIRDFVHNSFPVVADPDQVTRKAFDIFGIYLIDKQGILQSYIPGTKEARPRMDMILGELAKFEGVEAPEMKDLLAHVSVATAEAARAERTITPDEIVGVRWMWSNNLIWAKDRFKLAFVTTIADGYHVYGNDEARMSPFKIDFELPEGIELTKPFEYPKAKREIDPILKVPLSMYDGDIPMPVIYLKAAEDLEPGDLTVKATVHYQACNDTTCLAPTTKTILMPLKVVPRETRRGKVAGSEAW